MQKSLKQHLFIAENVIVVCNLIIISGEKNDGINNFMLWSQAKLNLFPKTRNSNIYTLLSSFPYRTKLNSDLSNPDAN